MGRLLIAALCAACAPPSWEGIECVEGRYPGRFEVHGESAEIALPDDCRALDELSVSDTELRDLRGLEGIEEIGHLRLADNPRLETLTGLDNVVRLQSLSVTDNPALTSLAALSSFDGALERLLLRDNALADLTGLAQVIDVTELLMISEPELTSLSGLEGLREAGVVALIDNARMTTLAGLEGLQHVASVLGITDNPALTDISALAAVTVGEETSYFGCGTRILDNGCLALASADDVPWDSPCGVTVEGNGTSCPE